MTQLTDSPRNPVGALSAWLDGELAQTARAGEAAHTADALRNARASADVLRALATRLEAEPDPNRTAAEALRVLGEMRAVLNEHSAEALFASPDALARLRTLAETAHKNRDIAPIDAGPAAAHTLLEGIRATLGDALDDYRARHAATVDVRIAAQARESAAQSARVVKPDVNVAAALQAWRAQKKKRNDQESKKEE